MPRDFFAGPAEYGDTDNTLLAKIWYWLARLGGGIPGSGALSVSIKTPSAGTTGQFTSTGTATIAIPANTGRSGAILKNTDAANPFAYGYSASVTFATGFILAKGDGVSIAAGTAIYVIDDGSNHATGCWADEAN